MLLLLLIRNNFSNNGMSNQPIKLKTTTIGQRRILWLLEKVTIKWNSYSLTKLLVQHSKQQVLAMHFYHGNLTAAWYYKFLEDIFLAFIDDIPLKRQKQLIFQQHWIPLHNSDTVTDFLNDQTSDWYTWIYCITSIVSDSSTLVSQRCEII